MLSLRYFYDSCIYCIIVLQNSKVFNSTVYFGEVDASFTFVLQRESTYRNIQVFLMSDRIDVVTEQDGLTSPKNSWARV